jgi:hypothetical protein
MGPHAAVIFFVELDNFFLSLFSFFIFGTCHLLKCKSIFTWVECVERPCQLRYQDFDEFP